MESYLKKIIYFPRGDLVGAVGLLNICVTMEEIDVIKPEKKQFHRMLIYH